MATPPEDTRSEALLNDFGKALKEERRSAVFACGGSVPILARDGRDAANMPEAQNEGGEDSEKTKSASTERHEVEEGRAASAVTLRWDGVQASSEASQPTGFKAQLPFDQGGAKALEQLIRDCQPATFGQGGKDVFDETYRKAGKLDNTQFSTNFNPYEVGIIDVIAQVLLPSVGANSNMRGVRAELYKLNIYSAPSGRFRAHVDTPRHESQFGSLVVCLPCAHEGGALVVRHKSNAVTFDWSHADANADASSIRWAAFYSDCEHEVLEVTSGHRVTLTYNLYVARGTGALTGRKSMDPTRLPFFAMAERMLGDPDFVPDGCTLGIYCSHAYAHTSRLGIQCLPSALKGIDMVVYETFRALDCRVYLVPVSRVDADEYQRGGLPGWAHRCLYLVGTHLHGLTHTPEAWYEGEYTEGILQRHWSHSVGSDIRWLNERTSTEPALMYPTYGNEPSMNVEYSSAALLIEIPALPGREPPTDEDEGASADEDEDASADEDEGAATDEDEGTSD